MPDGVAGVDGTASSCSSNTDGSIPKSKSATPVRMAPVGSPFMSESTDYSEWRYWLCPDCDRVTIFVEDECNECGFTPEQ